MQEDVCNATATPSFPNAEDTWSFGSIPAMIHLNHAAHHMDRNACLSIGGDEHVNLGEQPLSTLHPKPGPSLMKERGVMLSSLAPLDLVPVLALSICTLIGSHPKPQALTWCRAINIAADCQACEWMATSLDNSGRLF